ncbi:MAG TPA: RNA polymerase sigma factor [Actinomycetota bacterium]|nr:RNA polymerase sigma factor [Actinomycetota bacterium]
MLSEQQRTALEEAYRTLGGDLWRAVYAFAEGDRAIADDAVAHAFIEAGPRLGRIRELRPWLYSVAFRRAAADLRAGRRTIPLESTIAGQRSIPDPDVDLVELLQLLAPLSSKQRSAFVLRQIYGYSTAETASLLGVSEVAVRVHLHGARTRLKTSLEEVERL